MNMKSGAVLAAIGIGAFLGVVVVCGGLGGVFLWLVYDELQNLDTYVPVTGIDYTLTGPESVRVGEAATLVITVTNTDPAEHRTLHSINLYTELAEQGEVKSAPAAAYYRQDEDWAVGELLYGLPLPPGATEVVEVELNPTEPGWYNVNIDVCIDTTSGYIERFHDLVVLPADANDEDDDGENNGEGESEQ